MPLSYPQILSAVKAHFGTPSKTTAEIVAMLNGTTPAPSPAVTEADVNRAIADWISGFPDAASATSAAKLMTPKLGTWKPLKPRVVANLDRGMLISFLFGTIFCVTVFGVANLGTRFRGRPAQLAAADKSTVDALPTESLPTKDKQLFTDYVSADEWQEALDRSQVWGLDQFKRREELLPLLKRMHKDDPRRDDQFRHMFSPDR